MIGERVERREDARLLTGRGRFVDDVDVPGQLWLRVVRSTVASAAIERVDVDDARALPGVHAALSATDLGEVARIPIRVGPHDPSFDPFLQPILADGRVRYVGEPVAVVVADDPYLAEDAAELVRVDFVDEPALVDAASARDAGRVATRMERSTGDVAAAMAAAARVVEIEVEMGRHAAVPLETRGLVAAFEPNERRMTIWGATKVPHFNRGILAGFLGLPVTQVSLRASDAGGGFGARGELYPEDFLVPYLAMRLGRPIKWVEDRVENLVATNHSRQQRRRLRAAFDADARLLAIEDECLHDNGAYLRTHGALVPELTISMLPGPYRVPAYGGAIDVTLTNKTPAGTYRGPGRYEATFARERLFDLAAAELGLDRAELRRRNLLEPADLPLHRALPVLGHDVRVDVGNPLALLDQTLEAAGWDEWQAEAEAARARGVLLGNGLACFLEKSGGGGYEEATVTVGRDGRVHAVTGGASVGQGIETVVAQTIAAVLRVRVDDVDVVCGDTDRTTHGGGSWASRSTIYSGAAATNAADEVADLARRVAAKLLEVDPADLVLESGRVVVAGSPATGVTLAEVAAACAPGPASASEPAPRGLTATATATELAMTYPYGVHLAQVRVDAETGAAELTRYFVGYEIGRAVNPMLVEGQLVGGAAQGIGGALLEEFRYDENGQPLSATFMDYLMPTAHDVPEVGSLVREDAPSPGNPLGVMGAGEGGATGAGAAIASALDDALGRPGAIRRLPVGPGDLRGLAAR